MFLLQPQFETCFQRETETLQPIQEKERFSSSFFL